MRVLLNACIITVPDVLLISRATVAVAMLARCFFGLTMRFRLPNIAEIQLLQQLLVLLQHFSLNAYY